MIQRLGAAAVGLAVLIPAIVFGGTLAVEIIVPLVMAVCVGEYAAMAFPNDRRAAIGFVGVGVAGVYSTAVYAPHHLLLALGVTVAAALTLVTFRPGPSLDGAADRVGRHILGVFWISLLAFMPGLRQLEHGLAWVFLVLAISWCGDTGGYFAGKYLGSHKLYELVSPKKTWEGVAGGITLSTFGVFVVRQVGLPELSVAECLWLGPIGCTAGIVGDLAESLLKRAFQVKDSGTIMPGHGGLLDRIDSVLFVLPVVFAFATLF